MIMAMCRGRHSNGTSKGVGASGSLGAMAGPVDFTATRGEFLFNTMSVHVDP
jgi:hypothetical protein